MDTIKRHNYQNIIKLEQIDKQNETIWATQSQISIIFDVSVSSISEHITNIYTDRELDVRDTFREFRNVSNQPIKHYNLDMIIAVGYRVNSKKATQFRQWATKTLKSVILNKPKELSRKDLALLVIQQEEEKEKLLLENQQQQNIIKEQEKHLVNSQDMNYTTVAKNLHVHPVKFTQWLRDNGYINKTNIPYQEYIDRGYFSVKSNTFERHGTIKGFTQGFIKPKGYSYFLDKKIKGNMKTIEVGSY